MKPDSDGEEMLFREVAKLPPADRGRFLALKCAGNLVLRDRIEALLGAHDSTSFMKDLPEEDSAIRIDPSMTEGDPIGQSIGRYKILERIGEGGCGVVYVAEQSSPIRRRLALKLIKLGMDTEQVVARFEGERQALAMMDHPNIAKVHDASATESGRPYFVMELVRGIQITEYCDENRLPIRERLALFVRVCHAIQHAHQKGIIHRDIKPSNILLTLHDGVPVPKVIDFGIAKAMHGRLGETTVYTQLNQLVGTPAYMSPEQAEMSSLGVDTRTDIYGLGVLLYELLVGKTPFDGKELVASGLDEMRRIIRQVEPLRPSARLARMPQEQLASIARRQNTDGAKLVQQLKGDLDWIAIKCLEKDRTRRYETANALAMDIERHLQDEPVLASPPSRTYRLIKLVRRNTGAFAVSALFLAALVAGIVVSVSLMLRAKQAENLAQNETIRALEAERKAKDSAALATAERNRAEVNLYAADMNVVQEALARSNIRLARERLRHHEPKAGSVDHRGWEWYYFSQLARGDEVFKVQTNGARVIAVLPSKLPHHALVAWQNGSLELRNMASLEAPIFLAQTEGELRSVILDSSGSYVAAYSTNSTITFWDWRDPFKLIPDARSESIRPLRSFYGPGKLILTQAKDPNGPWEVAGSDIGLSAIWKYQTDEVPRVLPESGQGGIFSRHGQFAITGTWAERATICNTADSSVLRKIPNIGRAMQMALSPDDRWVLISSYDGAILCDVRTGHTSPLKQGGKPVRALHGQFSADSKRFATSHADGTVGVWDVSQRAEIGRLRGNESDVAAIAFSQDGEWLMTADSIDGALLGFRSKPSPRTNHAFSIFSPAVFTVDNSFFAVGDKSNNSYHCSIVNPVTRQTRTIPAEPNPVGFTRDGSLLITATVAEPLPVSMGRLLGLKYWNISKGELEAAFDFIETNHIISAVALSPDGGTLAAGDNLGNVHLFDTRTGIRTNTLPSTLPSTDSRVWNLVYSPDGKRLAVGIVGDVSLWDLQKTERILSRNSVGSPVAISSDGRHLAFSTDKEIQILEIETGTTQILSGHRERIYWLAFSPDGRTLASGGEDLKLWNLPAGRVVTSFEFEEPVMYVRFSPDAKHLIGGMVGKAYIWSVDLPATNSPRRF